MREIIFRGKRVDNGEWVYGGFHKHQKYTPSPIIPKGEELKEPECACLVIESGFSDWNMPKPILGHEVDPATVGQYTGLKDKNGKEIYEGDILDCSYVNPMTGNKVERLFFVECGKAAFVARCIGHSPFGDTYLHFENTKGNIIGNIHDNPELLEQSSC